MDKISRRDFLKATLAGSSALVAPTIINYLGKSSPSSDKEFLEIRDGNFYMGGEEYIMKGANYLSRDNPWKLIKNFNTETVDKELDLTEEIGINAIRTPITYVYSLGLDRMFDDSGEYTASPRKADIYEDYFENFDRLLDIADGHAIKVMPILFGHAYWQLYEPDFFDVAKKYLKQWLPEFADDERIIGWDVKNEPDIYDFFPESSKRKFVDFLTEITTFIDDIDNNHPKTFGWMEPESSKYDLGSDFTSFHYYRRPRGLGGEIREAEKHSDKPLVLSEFGRTTLEESETNPGAGRDEQDQEQYYSKILSEAEELDGFYLWRLLDNPQEITDEEGHGPVYKKKDGGNFKDYQLRMGVFRTDYSKKPAAHVVEQYYKWVL